MVFGVGVLCGAVIGLLLLVRARRVQADVAGMLVLVEDAVAANEERVRCWTEARERAEVALAKAEWLRERTEAAALGLDA